MLNLKKKQNIFTTILNRNEESYADSFNAEILMHASNFDFDFLKDLHSKIDIENWIKNIKNKIVMHEDDDRVEEIIADFIVFSV